MSNEKKYSERHIKAIIKVAGESESLKVDSSGIYPKMEDGSFGKKSVLPIPFSCGDLAAFLMVTPLLGFLDCFGELSEPPEGIDLLPKKDSVLNYDSLTGEKPSARDAVAGAYAAYAQAIDAIGHHNQSLFDEATQVGKKYREAKTQEEGDLLHKQWRHAEQQAWEAYKEWRQRVVNWLRSEAAPKPKRTQPNINEHKRTDRLRSNAT